MKRSVVMAAALCAALLLCMVALRFSGGPAEQHTSSLRDRTSATEPGPVLGADGGDDRRTIRRRGGASTAAAKREGHASPDTREQNDRGGDRPALAGAEPSADAARERRAGREPNRRERAGTATTGGLGAAPVAGDDANFRAAAERLADIDPARPLIEDDIEEPVEELTREPPTTPVIDDSVTYNSGDYRFSLDSPFQIPNTGDAGTVALWLQPEWSSDNNDDAAMIELGDGLFRVYKNVNVLRFEVMSDSPEHSAGVSIAEWQPGEWHSISATWEGQYITFYVDGQPVGAPIRGGFELQGNTPVTIGSLHPPDQPVAPGTISDVSLRNRALPAEEIARLHNRSAIVRRP